MQNLNWFDFLNLSYLETTIKILSEVLSSFCLTTLDTCSSIHFYLLHLFLVLYSGAQGSVLTVSIFYHRNQSGYMVVGVIGSKLAFLHVTAIKRAIKNIVHNLAALHICKWSSPATDWYWATDQGLGTPDIRDQILLFHYCDAINCSLKIKISYRRP